METDGIWRKAERLRSAISEHDQDLSHFYRLVNLIGLQEISGSMLFELADAAGETAVSVKGGVGEGARAAVSDSRVSRKNAHFFGPFTMLCGTLEVPPNPMKSETYSESRGRRLLLRKNSCFIDQRGTLCENAKADKIIKVTQNVIVRNIPSSFHTAENKELLRGR